LHQGHATGSRDIQNGWILSGQTSDIHSLPPLLALFVLVEPHQISSKKKNPLGRENIVGAFIPLVPQVTPAIITTIIITIIIIIINVNSLKRV
jgi:hypothetical protein